ncbi:MAG: hypothetical protein LW865_01895 [Betaproteobacteria bacterium]|jgi:hypothetical protein|nr:hypothetical protein [Betaproteobacteria bacterium]
MTTRIASLIAVCIALLTSGLADAADPPKGFRSFTWGAPVAGGLKKIAGPTDGVTMYVPASGKKPTPFLDIPVVEEAYSFDKGKFYSGSVWLDGRDNFDKMKAALNKNFGQPSFVNPGQTLYKWKWQGTKVEVSLQYQEKFARTTVTYKKEPA